MLCNIGKEFLLFITLERAISLLLKAVLDKVNFMSLYRNLFILNCLQKYKITTLAAK